MSKASNAGILFRRFPLASACLAGCLLLVIAYYFRQDALAGRLARFEQLESEGKMLERNVRNAVGLEEHLEKLNEGIDLLEDKLTRVDDVSGNQEYFYGLEKGTGVRVSILRPLGPAKGVSAGQAYQPAGFNIVVEGGYTQLIRFLRALEQGPRLYRLNDFSVQRTSGQESGPREVLTINLQLLASK